MLYAEHVLAPANANKELQNVPELTAGGGAALATRAKATTTATRQRHVSTTNEMAPAPLRISVENRPLSDFTSSHVIFISCGDVNAIAPIILKKQRLVVPPIQSALCFRKYYVEKQDPVGYMSFCNVTGHLCPTHRNSVHSADFFKGMDNVPSYKGLLRYQCFMPKDLAQKSKSFSSRQPFLQKFCIFGF